MSLLVVGSIAFDSIETPKGSVEDALGGSATFFAYAASFFTKPRLVSVVGEDFPPEHRQLLSGRNIDTTGLVTQPGKTFRWKGKYHQDMNSRDTISVHLNVFGTYDPVLPESFRDSTHVFLANSSPVLQKKVLEQVQRPQLIMADTMDLWIETQHDELLSLLPDLKAPSEYRAIVNAHFRIEPPATQPPILGVLNGTVQWLFAFRGRLSVTISAGDRLIDAPREELAKKIWVEVASLTGLPAALPPWQIVRERRATFAATPAQDASRPGTATTWRNLVLAGDWTDTGLPATIEGAIRSGNRAADIIANQSK